MSVQQLISINYKKGYSIHKLILNKYIYLFAVFFFYTFSGYNFAVDGFHAAATNPNVLAGMRGGVDWMNTANK
jgi:hypothetical protein